MYCGNKMPNVSDVVFPFDGGAPSESSYQENYGGDAEAVLDTADEIVPLENVTVKFRISETQVIAQVYPNRLTIEDIKKDIARKFEVEPHLLILKQCSKEISDECILMETSKDDFGIHEFSLELDIETSSEIDDETSMQKLDLSVYYNKYRLPDFITVHIPGEDTEEGSPKNIVVEILNKAIIKPFLCGYRDKDTGVEYHDAFTQTGPYFDKWKYRRYRSRDTQTFEYKEKLIDTMHDQTSQCFRDGNNVLYVSEALDFTIVPRKYQSHAQKMRIENKLEKIKLIQRNWRRFLIVRFMKNAAREYRRLIANREAEEEKFKEELEVKRIKREQLVKQFPRTKDDFDILYSEVRKWKMAEMKRIAEMYEGASRIAEVNILLDREVQLLNGIDRQRTLVFKAMQDFRNEQMLKEMGKPIKWIGYKDRVIHLDLLRTQRVRFLHELYNDLRKPLEKDARITLIGKVKEVLLDEDCPEVAELFDLLDREKNLLIYAQYCDVEVLRKRQNLLFLEIIKFTKDAVHTKTPKRLCEVCKQVKQIDQFAVRTRQNIINTCKKCYYMQFGSSETTIYTSILRAIQRDERKRRCSAAFAFVMQVDDVRYIIDQIWHRHSILSKNEDLSILRLPRWIKGDDWSPWNCICLTEAEARNHYKIQDLEKVYDHKLLLEVGNRHMLARSAFHKLAAVSTEFTESGNWWNVGMNKQRNVPIAPILKLKPSPRFIQNYKSDGAECST